MSWSFAEPSEERVRQFLEGLRGQQVSYSSVGMTRGAVPAGYQRDSYRCLLGHGRETFERAMEAVRGWQMFAGGWVRLYWPNVPLAVGTNVALVARGGGLWWLNACRIVYLVEETGEDLAVQRFGFAYGTLPTHVEQGEERFCVEWDRENDEVWYDLLALSRPNYLISWLAYPYVRRCQRGFARGSQRAMQAAVAGGRVGLFDIYVESHDTRSCFANCGSRVTA